MSDRTVHLTVVLDKDYRIEDDAQEIINAIRMVRGVLSVEANVTDPQTFVAAELARTKLVKELWDVLYPRKDRNHG